MYMRSHTIMGHIVASNRITIMTSVVHLGITLPKVPHNSQAKIPDSQQEVVVVIRLG
jgi:hypothetical protein